MLVAWVYVVPPLQGRLTNQKLGRRAGQRPPDQRDADDSQLAPIQPRQRPTHRHRRDLARPDPQQHLVASRRTGHRLHAEPGAVPGLRQWGLAGRRRLPDARQGGEHRAPGAGHRHDHRRARRGDGHAPVTPSTGNTVVAAALVTSSLEDVDNAVDAVQRQLLFATVLALGISLILGYMASYFIARRLKRIERSAELIAGGDLSAKVPETVEDEIGQLADTFNVMADRLRSAFAQVEYERDRVEVLLNDLSEGVIGVCRRRQGHHRQPRRRDPPGRADAGGRDRRRGAPGRRRPALARLPGGRRLRHDRVRPRRRDARGDHVSRGRRRRLHLHRRAA